MQVGSNKFSELVTTTGRSECKIWGMFIMEKIHGQSCCFLMIFLVPFCSISLPVYERRILDVTPPNSAAFQTRPELSI